MKKRIIAIVAVIALVAILSAVLVGCSASSYADKLEKAGYTVTTAEEGDTVLDAKNLTLGDGYEGKIVWSVTGIKAGFSLSSGIEGGLVTVYKFEKMSDAKKYYNEFLKDTDKDCKHIVGSIVIFGDAESVKAAK